MLFLCIVNFLKCIWGKSMYYQNILLLLLLLLLLLESPHKPACSARMLQSTSCCYDALLTVSLEVVVNGLVDNTDKTLPPNTNVAKLFLLDYYQVHQQKVCHMFCLPQLPRVKPKFFWCTIMIKQQSTSIRTLYLNVFSAFNISTNFSTC